MDNTNTRLFAAVCVLCLGAAAPMPGAAAETWRFDTPHTQALFVVDHLGFTDLTGQFRVIDGELMLDREDLGNSSVSATIQAASIDMNHDGINDHLRNEDFFHVDEFPVLEFRSTSVRVVDEQTLEVEGELTMRGHARPITLDVDINRIGSHPMSGRPHAGFTATTTLRRSDWGIAYAVPAVGDEVRVRINLEAVPAVEP